MKTKLLLSGITMMVLSCSSPGKIDPPQLLDDQTFLLTEQSADPTYGFAKENPIKVGNQDGMAGPINERRFLNALSGPNGEEIWYRRSGSCCHFKTKNGLMGKSGLLDVYRVTWAGAKDTVSIYINMYDPGSLKAPVGFSIKKHKRKSNL